MHFEDYIQLVTNSAQRILVPAKQSCLSLMRKVFNISLLLFLVCPTITPFSYRNI